MSEIGLIIWRFQPLHKGHILLIERSLEQNPASLVLIGSTNKDDVENPYSYELRKDLIGGEFPTQAISIWRLPDFPNDIDWINCILSYIPERVSHLRLYCGDIHNDSAVKSLKEHESILPFTLEIIEIPRSVLKISATQVRALINENNLEKLEQYLGKYSYKKLTELQ